MLDEKSDERARSAVNRALGCDEDAVAAETRLRQAQEEEEQLRRKRRPNFDFSRMHIPEGSFIELANGDHRATAQVAAPRKVIYGH